MLYIHWRVAPQRCRFCWPWRSFKCGSLGTLGFQGSQPVDTTDVNGSSAVQAVVWDALRLAQDVFAGHGQAGGELSALQRAAQAAAEPLIALGRSVAATAIGYLGSNTAVAIAIGLGVLRLGLGALTHLQTKAAPGRRFAWAVTMHVSDFVDNPQQLSKTGKSIGVQLSRTLA